MTDLFMFYEQLKIVNFCPQNDLFLPEKQEIFLSWYQTLHWYFNNLKSSHHHWSKLITTTIPISKDNHQY